MTSSETIKRVRIYLNERDQASGQPLYLAALERLQREGATGATVLRGIAGFGAGQRLRTASASGFSSSPLVIEWVDRIERVGRILPLLDDLLQEALITVEDVRVYRAILRSSGPFGERSVGQLMQHEPASAHPETSLRTALALMLEREQTTLPVVDAQGTIVGILSAADLEQRGGLALPLRLLPVLNETERQALLDSLPERALAEVMTNDIRTVYVESSIPQALNPLIEWGLDNVPVLDREGQLAGLFGTEQALHAAVRAAPTATGAIRDAEPPTPIGLVMQRAVPTVPSSAALATVASLVLSSPERFVVVLDEGKPVGVISDSSLIGQLPGPARAAWLTALRAPALPVQNLDQGDFPTAAQLAMHDTPVLNEQAPQEDALQLMLSGTHMLVLVVNAEGKLQGVLTRRAILRALAQAAA